MLPPLTEREMYLLRRGLTAGVVVGSLAGLVASLAGVRFIGALGLFLLALIVVPRLWILIEEWLDDDEE